MAGEKNSTHLTIEYDRLIATGGDADQDKNIPTNSEIMTIFASNTAEVPSSLGTQWSYHGSNRNGMKINFSAASDCSRAYANLRVLMSISTPYVSSPSPLQSLTESL